MSLINAAGSIRIELTTDGQRVVGVALSSSRRLSALQRLFVGRGPEHLLETLPRVLSVCATAQMTAAVRACEQAMAVRPAAAQERARDLLVLTELAREHLIRIFLGWSAWLGLPPSADVLPGIGAMRTRWPQALYPDGDGIRPGGGRLLPERTALEQQTAALRASTAQALGTAAEHWESIDSLGGLIDWSRDSDALAARLVLTIIEHDWAALGRTAVEPLPKLPPDTLAELMESDTDGQFVAAPLWGNRPRETGALARQWNRPLIASLRTEFGNGLLTRIAARLLELASLPAELVALIDGLNSVQPVPIPEQATGTGLAQVEAARGRLVHWVQIEQGLVEAHRILAPTEWNFHPNGLLPTALRDLSEGEDLARRARLLVDAVDPCVECEIRVI